MREEVRAKIAATEGATAPGRTVAIDEVKFDGPTHLPEATRERLVVGLKQGNDEADSGWLVQIQEGSILGAWQDDGFFKAEVTATASVSNTDSAVEHVLLTIHADEGHQYELGGIQFRSSDPAVPLIFSNAELRKLFQMHEGDILRAQKIREALDALRNCTDRTDISILWRCRSQTLMTKPDASRLWWRWIRTSNFVWGKSKRSAQIPKWKLS